MKTSGWFEAGWKRWREKKRTLIFFYMTKCAAGFTGFMLDLNGWRCVEQTWDCFSSILMLVGCRWFLFYLSLFFCISKYFLLLRFVATPSMGSVVYAGVWSSSVSSDVLVGGASSVLTGTISAYSVVSSLPRKQLDSSELFRSSSA